MADRAVLVVGETPSLGQSIVDLLESGGVPNRFVSSVDSAAPLARISDQYAVVVAACNESYCSTARRWARGEIPDVAMVAVGARDPALHQLTGVRVVTLPLSPETFLALVRSLIGSAHSAQGRSPDRPGRVGGFVRDAALL
ncbi:MAG: hypothetical protein L3J81_00195 [Thermoplasmata archaeon]|jgi:CheY-like chemotaxis protein|nr:hypothetical protein [Thermoplasmata archaeon]